MRENKNRTGLIIGILVLIIMGLLITIAYVFVVKPIFTGYIVEAQNQGYEQALIQVAQEAAICQQPIPLRIGNQTVNIVALRCFPQIPQQ